MQRKSLVSRLARRTLTAEHRKAIAGWGRRLAQARFRLFPRYRTNDRLLADWHDRYRGETCVIIGNGPSMRGFDLARLDGYKCFCLNRGYLMWQAQGRTPDFLVAVNDLVLTQFTDDIRRAGRARFVPWDAFALFKETPDTAFIETLWQPRFHTNIRSGTWMGGTVTFTTMQIAYHMGFSRVILIGVDHSFQHEGAANEELLMREADPNHFDPNYFGPGTRWLAPDLVTSEIGYRIAKKAFEADGRKIVDATEGGQLRVFDRVCLD